MTIEVYEVNVVYTNMVYDRFKKSTNFFGRKIAVDMAKTFFACDNVEAVDVVDCTTGEVIYSNSTEIGGIEYEV